MALGERIWRHGWGMVRYSISLYFIPEVESLKNQKGASSHASVRYLFGMWRSIGRHRDVPIAKSTVLAMPINRAFLGFCF